MPLWTALGTKSSTSVAPFGAPGSAPLPPQPATPASARAVASSATALLMPRRKLFHPPIVSTLPPLTCRREPRRKSAGTSSARTRSAGERHSRISGRVDRHAAACLLHLQRRHPLRLDRRTGPVRH